MTARRSRVVRAPRAAVWEIVGDPWHLPRWWPHTARVEAVSDAGWTSVLGTERGPGVRADWTVELTEAPVRRRWRQELAGSPFERLFSHHSTEVSLADAPDGTTVSIEVQQRARGWTRLAPFLVRRAAKRQIDAALSGLAEIVEAAP